MNAWKIELTWHDGKRDRKYRDVVEAADFDAARAKAYNDAKRLGLFDASIVVATEGERYEGFDGSQAMITAFLCQGFRR